MHLSYIILNLLYMLYVVPEAREETILVSAQKTSFFGSKYLFRSPHTQLKMSRLTDDLIKELSGFCRHEHDCRLSQGLVNRIHLCPAYKC